MKAGDLITKTSENPKGKRHGILLSLRGKTAVVKLHGMKESCRLPVSRLVLKA